MTKWLPTGIAGVPQMINFQGRLTDAQGDTLNGDYNVTFKICADSNCDTVLWQENWPTLEVRGGIFNVLLGSANPIPDTVFTGPKRWLGMRVEDEDMNPHQEIASVGYAFHSATSDTAEFAFAAPCTIPTDQDWSFSGDDIYRLNGNVGIGTTGSPYRLYVMGSTLPQLYVNGIPSSRPAGIAISEHGIVEWRLSAGEAGVNKFSIKDRDAATYALVIDNSGNVGIGTENPQGKLHISDGSLYVWSDGLNPEIWAMDDALNGVQLTYNSAGNYGRLQSMAANVGSKLVLNPQGGNVGIGTTDPVATAKLTVAASPYDADIALVSGGEWRVSSDATNRFNIKYVSEGAQYPFVIDTTGNVGIGTTSPQRTLHIKDVLRLEPQASAPSGGLGDLYVGTDGKLYFHNGSAWKEVQLAP